MAEYNRNFLIVSDLHLSEGFHPVTGLLSPNEDFLCDESFADFLRFHDEYREQLGGRPWRLIVAGDLFDFLQVTSRPPIYPYFPAADAEELKEKIEDLENKRPILARSVYTPGKRRDRATWWLEEAINQAGTSSEDSYRAVINCAKRLRDLAKQVEDILVWDLERLTLETLTLVLKDKAKLSKNDRDFGLDTSWPEAVWKLDRIAEGHPIFFGALAWFLDRGNSLVIVKGNHDVELHWSEVRDRVRDLLADSHLHLRQSASWWMSRPMKLAMKETDFWRAIETQYLFSPWIYFEPGLLYVEHGNQYEVLNAFANFRKPVLQDRDHLVQLPPGSLFSRYFFNRVEESFGFADNLRPITRFIAWAFQNEFLTMVDLLRKHQWQLWKFVGKLALCSYKDWMRQRGKEQGKYQEAACTTAQTPSASDVLCEDEKLAIEKLALNERRKLTSKFLNLMVIALPVFLSILILSLTILIVLVFLTVGNVFLRFAGGAAVLVIGYLLAYAVTRLVRMSDYLQGPAEEIWEEVLKSKEALRVRYLVFGHIHEPNMYPVGEKEDASWYINTGSWLYKVNEVESWDRMYTDFTFLQIIPDDKSPGVPRLLRWNETTGRPERIRRRLASGKWDKKNQ